MGDSRFPSLSFRTGTLFQLMLTEWARCSDAPAFSGGLAFPVHANCRFPTAPEMAESKDRAIATLSADTANSPGTRRDAPLACRGDPAMRPSFGAISPSGSECVSQRARWCLGWSDRLWRWLCAGVAGFSPIVEGCYRILALVS